MRARQVVAILLVILMPVGPLSAKPGGEILEVTAGQEYGEGALLKLSTAGVSWRIPESWIGGIPPGSTAFLLGSKSEAGVGVILPMAAVSPESLEALLNEVQDLGDGVVLEPTGDVARSRGRLGRSYQGETYIGRALALLGPHGQGVVYFFAGPVEQITRFNALIDHLAASTGFEKPDPGPLTSEWTDRLNGMALRTMSSYSSGTSGGYNSESTLDLCPDGVFQYSSSGATSIYVPGATGTGVHEDRSSGRWSLSMSSGQPVLVLNHEDGRVTTHQLGFDGEKTFLDGDRVYRVASEACP